jgi:predicted RNase H-like HicB family nuclease
LINPENVIVLYCSFYEQSYPPTKVVFLIENEPEQGYTAQAIYKDFSIFTEGDTVDELKRNILDSLKCHFEKEEEIPPIIHYAPASYGL